MILDQIVDWTVAKAALLFAAISGAVIHVSIFWTSPVIATRQFLACVLFGINIGPALFSVVSHYTFISSSSAEGATICATGLCGVYLTEGLVLLAKRWARNPTPPWRKP